MTDILGRMADKFTVGDSCWEWTGSRTPAGYGQFRLNGRPPTGTPGAV